MFGGTGGYFRMDSWILGNIVELGTQQFCRRFLNRRNDPGGRQYDQMTQAARSGCANNAEGSARHATSTETEMRLTDVARSSLAELSGDYLNWLLQQGKVPWPKNSPMARRKARSGKNAGRDFWGCTGYPNCRGVRAVEDGRKAGESSESRESNQSNDSIPSIR